MESGHRVAGFTLIELLTSIAILVVITASVSMNLSKSRMREELDSSARQVATTLRNLQAQALAARTVKTCKPAAVVIVCELGISSCGGAPCSTTLVPMAVGMTLTASASSLMMFAETDVTLEDRRQDVNGRENLARIDFASSKSGTAPVTITSLLADATSLASVSVAFERQNGSMRIEACDTPPLAPACGASIEPMTLTITLTHARLGKSVVVKLNRLTGKISTE